MSYSAALAVHFAKQDVGFREGPNNRNPYSLWQYGGAYNPWCDSAVCYWSYRAGFRFPSYSAWGERGDMNVTSHRIHATRQGIWRPASALARPGWLVVLNFTMRDQHIEMVLADSGSKVATIGGNTGDMVAYRTRYRNNIGGFIAMDEAGQNGTGYVPVTPGEIVTMGMTAASTVPGAGTVGSGPLKGRKPFVAAVQQPGGAWQIVGYNNALLSHSGKPGQSAYGLSIVTLGKLNKPIKDLAPEVDNKGNFTGTMVALAEDGGTFAVAVKIRPS